MSCSLRCMCWNPTSSHYKSLIKTTEATDSQSYACKQCQRISQKDDSLHSIHMKLLGPVLSQYTFRSLLTIHDTFCCLLSLCMTCSTPLTSIPNRMQQSPVTRLLTFSKLQHVCMHCSTNLCPLQQTLVLLLQYAVINYTAPVVCLSFMSIVPLQQLQGRLPHKRMMQRPLLMPLLLVGLLFTLQQGMAHFALHKQSWYKPSTDQVSLRCNVYTALNLTMRSFLQCAHTLHKQSCTNPAKIRLVDAATSTQH